MGLAARDSLESTCMTLLEVVGEAECAAAAPGEPAWEALKVPLGTQTLSQRMNGNRQPPCQRREVLAEARRTKQPPSASPLVF